MPVGYRFQKDYNEIERKRNEYRKKLIAKGIMDGSMKMLKLMCKKKF